MERAYEFLTFDCYGTLIDWEGGIYNAFRQILDEVGIELRREEVSSLYVEVEPQVEGEEFRLYRDVLTETSSRMFEHWGAAVPAGRREFLAESLPGWRPFADTQESLGRLHAAGYRLGILSNVDDTLLAGTLEQLAVGFDFRITAEQVKSYKPAKGHFLRARERIGGRPWLHVAQSLFHDMRPAGELGLPTAWINRGGDSLPEDLEPDFVYPDLAQLADALVPA